MCNYHMYKSAKGRYDIILGRDILTSLVLDLKQLTTPSNNMMDL